MKYPKPVRLALARYKKQTAAQARAVVKAQMALSAAQAKVSKAHELAEKLHQALYTLRQQHQAENAAAIGLVAQACETAGLEPGAALLSVTVKPQSK